MIIYRGENGAGNSLRPNWPVWNKARYKLPEIDQHVLCSLKSDNRFLVLYYDFLHHKWKGKESYSYKRSDVLFWCELPPLPEALK